MKAPSSTEPSGAARPSQAKPSNRKNRLLPPPEPPRPSRVALWARATAHFGKLGVGVLLVFATAGATAYGGYRLALGSSQFALQKLEVSSSLRSSERELLQRAGISLGQNLLGIDVRAAEERLLEDPWVRSVRLVRQLPHTLRVELVEREALALASLDGDLFLLGADAEPFKAWQAGDPEDLPVLTGVTLEALAKDRAGAVARLATGLSVLSHYERLPVSQQHRAQEVNLAPDGSVVLSVGARGVSLHLGQGPWPKKMLMVAEVMRTFENKRELPGVVFLDNALHPERVVVRMR
jgi:cell division septal protein FtsQ